MKKEFLVEKPSKFGFEETVESLKAAAEENGWNIPAVHDLQQSLAKSGKHVKPIKVLEICKPAYSGEMLELNDERIMSVMMPCRISVYEKDDGNVYVALIDANAFTEDLPLNVAEVMKAATDDSLKLVKIIE